MHTLEIIIMAGMPSVLPEDIAVYFRLNEDISARLQSISFFLLILFCATVAIWGLWNVAAKDSGFLPKLTFVKACCVTLLWATLFVLVLTMISGARELLTPGAWRKKGVTYTIDPDPTPAASVSEQQTKITQ